MIDHLVTILETFPGSANRTRCFAHILNLVAKCIMKQFDTPKKPEQEFDLPMEDGLEDLQVDDDPDEEEDGDKIDGEDVNEEEAWEGMTEAEIDELKQSVKPVRHVLAKVSLLYYLNNYKSFLNLIYS
jgi:hypothetical protein